MTFPFDSAWAGSVFSSSPSSSTQSLPATPYGYLPCSSFSLTPIFGMGAPRMGAGLHFNFPSPGFPPPACDWTGNFPAQTPFPGQSPFLHGQPPLAFTKGDTEGVNALLRRTIILYMKLDNGTSNWTFSYHDQTMRNFLTCTFRVLPTQIVCSKIVSSEGFVFGTFVLQSEKLAQDLVHNFNSAPVQSYMRIATSEQLLLAFSPSVKREIGLAKLPASSTDEAINNVFIQMSLPVRQQAQFYTQPRNVFF